MEFTPFTVVAGTNASGKSNLFDALKLLSNLAETDLITAFNNNLRGEANEQFSQFSDNVSSDKISIAVEMLVDSEISDNWGGSCSLNSVRLRYEIEIVTEHRQLGSDTLYITKEILKSVNYTDDSWIKRNISKDLLHIWCPKNNEVNEDFYITTENEGGIAIIRIKPEGDKGSGRYGKARDISQTLLSSINSVEYPHVFAAKQEMINWRFLQLNPEELSKPSPRIASDIITPSGGNLAAALFRLKMEDESYLDDISRELNNLLPDFVKVDVTEDIAENRFVINLVSEDGRIFSSGVLSEGTLRLLILCILKYDTKYKGTLCFEEPENGIHPYRINMMIELLQGLSTDLFNKDDVGFPLRQMIINTHSSVFVGNLFKENRFSRNISIWFSKLVTVISDKSGKSLKFKATKILPVRKGNAQLNFDFITPGELDMTELEVKRYLETKDFGD